MAYRFNPLPKIFDRVDSASSLPGNVAEAFTTDDGLTAVPSAHLVILHGSDTTENVAAGIKTITGLVATPGVPTNEVTTLLTNRIRGTTTTSDGAGQVQALITPFSIAAVGTYAFNVTLVAYSATAGAGSGVTLTAFCSARTTGVTSAVIGNQDVFFAEDSALSTASVQFQVSAGGNTFGVQVTGIAGQTIDWACLITYEYVG